MTDTFRSTDSRPEIEELVRRAKKLLEMIPEAKKRPLVIEFAGTPKSGKTTLCNFLIKWLQRMGFQVKKLRERAEDNPLLERKTALEFNLWNLGTYMAGLLELANSDADVVVMDRGLFDCTIWTQWHVSRGSVDKDDLRKVREFVELPLWRQLIDIVFVVRCSTEVSLQREPDFQLLQATGEARIMNEEVLCEFIHSLETLTTGQEVVSWKRVVVVDTTELSPDQGARQVAKTTVEAMEAHIDEKVFVVPTIRLVGAGLRQGFMPALEASPILQALDTHGRFEPRLSVAEASDDLVQPISAAMLMHDNQVYLFRKKEIDPTKQFHQKYMVWVGGHIRLEDKDDGGEAVWRQALLRELSEEVRIKYEPKSVELLGLVWDSSTQRNKQHLCILHKINLDSPSVAFAIGQTELSEAKGRSLSGKPYAPEEIVGLLRNKLEGGREVASSLDFWTKHVLTEYFQVELREQPALKL
ncbi:MAG: NUDIX domain-containing protein [Armatimonadetes bacterium]|nr:NUDIX domain-containing protein [Armatimonadota bacterium]